MKNDVFSHWDDEMNIQNFVWDNDNGDLWEIQFNLRKYLIRDQSNYDEIHGLVMNGYFHHFNIIL